jgi:hypothetical protein
MRLCMTVCMRVCMYVSIRTTSINPGALWTSTLLLTKKSKYLDDYLMTDHDDSLKFCFGESATYDYGLKKKFRELTTYDYDFKKKSNESTIVIKPLMTA